MPRLPAHAAEEADRPWRRPGRTLPGGKQALSYSPDAVYSVRDGQHAHILAGADGTDGSVSILVSEFIGIIARLRDKPVDAEELKSVADRMITTWESPRSRLSQARRAAQNELLGRRNNTAEKWKEQLAAVSPDDVQCVAAEAFGNGVFALPRRQEPFRAEIRHVPWFSSGAVAGHHARSADAPFVTARLILGASMSIVGEMRARLWLAAGRRASGVEPPPDFG